MTEMTDYKKCYVYAHIEPLTGEWVYVGKGTSCRAFRATGSGHRDVDHSKWLEDHYNRGYIPVRFIDNELSKEDAHAIEKRLIRLHKPRFNKLSNPDHKHSRWDEDIIQFAKDLRENDYSYTQIAFLLGDVSLVSRECKKTMSIWRMINEQ